jgi:hypothetical protein
MLKGPIRIDAWQLENMLDVMGFAHISGVQ